MDNNDISFILLFAIISYFLENFKYEFNISFFNIFLFMNLIGLYFIFKKKKISIKIEYNIDN